MSVGVKAGPGSDEVLLTFTVPAELHDGPVSVVGSFNHWTPGVDVLEPRQDGSRSVTIAVLPDRDVHFRYLGSGGAWFNDPDADTIGEGSVLRAADLRRRLSQPTSDADPGSPRPSAQE